MILAMAPLRCPAGSDQLADPLRSRSAPVEAIALADVLAQALALGVGVGEHAHLASRLPERRDRRSARERMELARSARRGRGLGQAAVLETERAEVADAFVRAHLDENAVVRGGRERGAWTATTPSLGPRAFGHGRSPR